MNFNFTNRKGKAIAAPVNPDTVTVECDGSGDISFTVNGEPFFMKPGDSITITS